MSDTSSPRRDWISLTLVGIIVALIMGSLVVTLVNRRLEEMEERVTHEPPAKYQAPDLSAFEATGASIDDMSITQSVYVPIYSHLYYDAGRPFLIESTLSIRNTDRTRPLYISSVRYYDTGGDLVTTHIDRLIRLKPLGTLDILVQRRDTKGGSGANFIVEWAATEEIEEPMIEAMMVGTAGNHGFSFSRSGKPLTSVSR